MTNEYEYLRGKIHDFKDGIKIKIVDIKMREVEHWITYETIYPHALSKRVSKKAKEFLSEFGHLFSNIDKSDSNNIS
jgi:hypothetical protein